MSSKKELTGGTGDVNPQTLVTQRVFASANNSFAHNVLSFPMPVPRFSSTSTTSIVVELLGVEYYYDSVPVQQAAIASATTFGAGIATAIATQPTLGALFEQPNIIDLNNHLIASTIDGTPTNVAAHTQFEGSRYEDLTDQAGHGLLIATDRMTVFAYCQTNVPATQLVGVRAKLYYRFKKVTLTEYIGIVQSQQNPF